MNSLRSIIGQFIDHVADSYDYGRTSGLTYAAVCALLLFASFVPAPLTQPMNQHGIALLTLVVSTVSIIAMSRVEPRPRLALFWVMAVAAQPFGFGWIIASHAANPEFPLTNLYWLHAIYGCVLLALNHMSNRPSVTTVFWMGGVFITIAITILDGVGDGERITKYFYYALGPYATMVWIGAIAKRNRQAAAIERLETMRLIGATVSHELRTPLTAISSRAQGTAAFLPRIVDHYRKTKNNSDQPNLSDRTLELVEGTFDDISIEARNASTFVDMTLFNTSKDPLLGQKYEHFTASQIVEEALASYPFRSTSESSRVSEVLVRNFEIVGPPHLLKHVIFNLLKNALDAVYAVDGAMVQITIGQDTSKNKTIEIRDSGIGMDSRHIPRIFDRFYSIGEVGLGPGNGLFFCREVLTGLGATIECSSARGKGTTFLITFPAENPEPVIVS